MSGKPPSPRGRGSKSRKRSKSGRSPRLKSVAKGARPSESKRSVHQPSLLSRLRTEFFFFVVRVILGDVATWLREHDIADYLRDHLSRHRVRRIRIELNTSKAARRSAFDRRAALVRQGMS
jgi:hypothetical protein